MIETCKAVERLALETCGWRLLTILKYVEKDAVVERLSSSDEKAYPLGGRKPLDRIAASHSAMEHGGIFLAATKADDYAGAMAKVVPLKPFVDAFFDKVMVMADDKALRENRVRLLMEIGALFGTVADFSKIQAES